MVRIRKHPYRLSLVAGTCLALALALTVLARPSPCQSDNPSLKTIAGTLAKVDATAKTFTIKTEEGEEVELHYTDDTRVEGAEGGVQGLASKDGARLAVQFTEKDDYRTAVLVKIEESGN